MPAEKNLGLNKKLMLDGEFHFDKIRFQELLHLATDVCLENPPDYEKTVEEERGVNTVIYDLGLRGLSAALDIMDPNEHIYISRSHSNDEEQIEYINASDPLRNPDRYSGKVDPKIQQNIEQFGDALLDEAYKALGVDVNDKINEFRDASTDTEQISILLWLNERVRALSRTARLDTRADDKSDYFYHPVRLAPRLMGRYPQNEYDPTCLGKSILTASFMRQTGVNLLHGGVVQMEYDRVFEWVSDSIQLLAEYPLLKEIDPIRDRLITKANELAIHPDTGFHALSAVQLPSEQWFVVDPNFNSTYALAEAHSAQVQRAYEDIHDSRVKGVERTVTLDKEYFSAIEQIRFLLFKKILIDISPDNLERAIVDSEGMLVSEVTALVKEALLTSEECGGSGFEDLALGNLCKYYDSELASFSDDLYHSTILDEAIARSIKAALLQDESPEDIIKRAQRDDQYLRRKIKDCQVLPYLTLINCLLVECDILITSLASGSVDARHSALEFGSAGYRVGASVLSDFATYCESDLSYSFWLSHWPGKVPISEHSHNAINNLGSHHSSLAHNNILWLEHVLPYSKQNGIIKEYTDALKE